MLVASLLVWLAMMLNPAQAEPAASAAAVREFVQQFYNWYVTMSARSKGEPEAVALKQRKADFAPELAQALEKDMEANAKAGELVGLDYDAFLNTQDPCDKYVVGGKTSEANGVWKVEVFAICEGKKEARPEIVAVLKERPDKSWYFINIEDPGSGTNLMQNLRALAKEREKYK